MKIPLRVGDKIDIDDLARRLASLQYKRNNLVLERGQFRISGDIVDIFPSHYEDLGWRLSFFGDEIESICEFDPLTGKKKLSLNDIMIYPASHYVTPGPALSQAISTIKSELKDRLDFLNSENRLVEAQRLEQRTRFDLEMIEATGTCKGIENYSRHLTGRKAGEAPPTLFEYLPPDALLFIDESHVTVPQVGAMYKGDRSRKDTLVEYGFRLPSAKDNRPLTFEEWEDKRPQTIFVSATPAAWELEKTGGVFVEQIIRPTGLLDPECIIRPISNQVDDLLAECIECAKKSERVLVTTLTKKMAEDLTEYLSENNIKVRYLHSDIDTLERIQIIKDLREGVFDVLVGINLLREGLDIPECALVAILDADKEGFLRSETSLIQTIGRAARNENGRVILYADKITGSIERAVSETKRRRQKQMDFNKKHGIVPKTIKKDINQIVDISEIDYTDTRIESIAASQEDGKFEKNRAKLEKQMKEAAENLDFEEAIRLREEIKKMDANRLGV